MVDVARVDMASLAQEARRYEDAQDELRARDAEIERLKVDVAKMSRLHQKIEELENDVAAASSWRSQTQRLQAQLVDSTKTIDRLARAEERLTAQLDSSRMHVQELTAAAKTFQTQMIADSTAITELESRVRRAESMAEKAELARGALLNLLEQ